MTSQAQPAVANLDQEIGERVLILMFRQKVTQLTLGRELGLNQAGIARRLRGETAWKATDLSAAARVLKTTIAYLVGEAGDPDDPSMVRPLGFEPRTHWFFDKLIAATAAEESNHVAEVHDIDEAFEIRERRGLIERELVLA